MTKYLLAFFISLSAVAGNQAADNFFAYQSLQCYDPADQLHKVTLKAPTLSANWTLTLPVDGGTNNYCLKTNGSGITSWAAVQSPITTGDLTDAGTDGITVGNGSGAVIGTGTTLSQHVADATHNGYLSSTDYGNIDFLNVAQTFTAAKTVSTSGAASTPAWLFTGTPFAGTATTAKPLVSIEWGSPTTNTWNTAGTAFGINAASAFTGKIMDLKMNGATMFSVDYGGSSSANQGTGVFFRNINDNSNSFNLCGQTGAVGTAKCISFYASNANTFKFYSLGATNGSFEMLTFDNALATTTIGHPTSGLTDQLHVESIANAAYNAYTTLGITAKASQTGKLTEWRTAVPAVVASVDVTGKGVFANLQDAALGAGIVTSDSSGNFTATGTTGSGNVVLATAPTMTNPVVGTQSLGDNSTKAASTAFVQSALAQLNPAAAVSAASTANIPGTYTNAVGGVCVGDTFTVTATGAFTIDGQTPAAGKRVLLKNQSSAFQNGVWDVTVAGSVGVSPVLTRSADWDSSADMNAGSLIPVINGTANANTVWYQTAAVTTCSSDAQVYTQFSGGGGSGGVTTWTVDNAVVVPTNGGTVSAQDYRWRCVGRNIQIKGHFTTGTPAASTFTLGLKYAVDSTQISSSSGGSYLGQVYQLQSGTANLVAIGEMAALFYDGSDTANVYLAYQVNGGKYDKQTGSGFFAASTNQDFYIEYPVVANAPCP